MTREPYRSRSNAVIPPRLSNFPSLRLGMARSASPAQAAAAAVRRNPPVISNVFKRFISASLQYSLRPGRPLPPRKITASPLFLCAKTVRKHRRIRKGRGRGIPVKFRFARNQKNSPAAGGSRARASPASAGGTPAATAVEFVGDVVPPTGIGLPHLLERVFLGNLLVDQLQAAPPGHGGQEPFVLRFVVVLQVGIVVENLFVSGHPVPEQFHGDGNVG